MNRFPGFINFSLFATTFLFSGLAWGNPYPYTPELTKAMQYPETYHVQVSYFTLLRDDCPITFARDGESINYPIKISWVSIDYGGYSHTACQICDCNLAPGRYEYTFFPDITEDTAENKVHVTVKDPPPQWDYDKSNAKKRVQKSGDQDEGDQADSDLYEGDLNLDQEKELEEEEEEVERWPSYRQIWPKGLDCKEWCANPPPLPADEDDIGSSAGDFDAERYTSNDTGCRQSPAIISCALFVVFLVGVSLRRRQRTRP